MNRLKKKYQVVVDEDLFAMASADLAGDILRKPIVTTSKEDIPLAILVKDLRKEKMARPNADDETLKIRKRGLLNGMLMEYLITWESMERHYEEKPPLKWTYEFYKENRLIRELEDRRIKKQISVTEKDIEQRYMANLAKYTGSPVVSIALLEDNEELIRKIWQEISMGQDFFVVAKEAFVEMGYTLPIK